MRKEYICKKCKHKFEDNTSTKFIKVMLKKCPACGSSDVTLSSINKHTFAKKTNK